jgi:hypothetical protein
VILWKWLLAFGVVAGIAIAVARKRDISRGSSHHTAPRERADRGIRFPIFAGDRFGDDWGRF